MIEILVQRGLGDHRGPDINDPLITSVPVALARGAAEINRASSDRKILSIDVTMCPWIMPGSMVGVTTGKGRRVGMLTSMEKEYSLTGNEFRASCRMAIETVTGGGNE